MNNLISTLIILGFGLLLWLIFVGLLKRLLARLNLPGSSKRVGLPNSKKDLVIDILCGVGLIAVIIVIFLMRSLGVSLWQN